MKKYKCPICEKGIINEIIVKNYETKFEGKSFFIKNAKIEVCDTCGDKFYDSKELQRWEKIFSWI